MHDLLTLSKASNMSLRVIPASWVLPVTALSGFTVLEFVNRPTVVYREEPASGVFIDEPEQVAAHLRIVREIRQLAMKPQRSKELVTQIKDAPAPDLVPVELFPADLNCSPEVQPSPLVEGRSPEDYRETTEG